MQEEAPYRIHYSEEDAEGFVAKSAGDIYEELDEAVKEGVEYYQFATQQEELKIELDIETLEVEDGK